MSLSGYWVLPVVPDIPPGDLGRALITIRDLTTSMARAVSPNRALKPTDTSNWNANQSARVAPYSPIYILSSNAL